MSIVNLVITNNCKLFSKRLYELCERKFHGTSFGEISALLSASITNNFNDVFLLGEAEVATRAPD